MGIDYMGQKQASELYRPFLILFFIVTTGQEVCVRAASPAPKIGFGSGAFSQPIKRPESATGAGEARDIDAEPSPAKRNKQDTQGEGESFLPLGFDVPLEGATRSHKISPDTVAGLTGAEVCRRW